MWSAAAETLVLIALAEIGDKSQLVCVALGARYRPLPVLLGAAVAYAALNAVAVGIGTMVDAVLPDRVLAGLVAVLFLVFGILSFRTAHAEEDVAAERAAGRSAFAAAVALLFVAELGDKTQIAVAALAGTRDPLGVWLGATAAMLGLSVVAVLVGRKLLDVVPVTWIHRLAGVLFLVFAAVAAWRAIGGG